MQSTHKIIIGSIASALLMSGIHSQAADRPFVSPAADRLIIKLPSRASIQATDAQRVSTLAQISQKTGIPLKNIRTLGTGAQLVSLPTKQQGAALSQSLASIRATGLVEYAEPDYKRQIKANSSPNDPFYNLFYPQQAGDVLVPYSWYLDTPSEDVYSMNVQNAWNSYTGNPNMVVAVLDTGILPHEDLNPSRVLAGYDFASGDVTCTGDGNERDNNPTDPGDWVDNAAINAGCDTQTSNSSWHGTFVNGIIAATANNGLGLTGVDWQAKILPVRVLSKGGGYDSDIADGMLWAAGLPIAGVPNNPTPAKVLNLSLGGYGACSRTYQEAIDKITAAGSVIVVAAGNDGGSSLNQTPANCNGVIAVAASSRAGYKTDYTDSGSNVALSAAGGGTVYLTYSTSNSGLTRANSAQNTYVNSRGTSFATPLVAGIASLVMGYQPSLSPAAVKQLLQSTATPFPLGSDCAGVCGTGVVNAHAALTALQYNFIAPTSPISQTVSINTPRTQMLTYQNLRQNSVQLGNTQLISNHTAVSIQSNTCQNTQIAPQNTCTITLIFNPPSLGSFNATLIQANTTQNQSYSTPIQINGVNPGIFTADITSVQLAGNTQQSPSQIITIRNTGGNTLRLSSLSLTGNGHNGFILEEGSCYGVIAPQESCQVRITLNTSILSSNESSKKVNATFVLSSADDNASLSIPLEGDISAAPSSGGGGCTSNPNGSTDSGLVLLLTLAGAHHAYRRKQKA